MGHEALRGAEILEAHRAHKAFADLHFRLGHGAYSNVRKRERKREERREGVGVEDQRDRFTTTIFGWMEKKRTGDVNFIDITLRTILYTYDTY